MKFKTLALVMASAASCLVAIPASAAPYLFELTGSRTATFTIDTTTVPDFVSSSFIGDQVSYNVVPGTFGGSVQTASVGFGTFLAATLNIGGSPQGFTQFAGPDLFTLVNSRPVFNVGTFNLTSIVSGNSTLKISAATAAVPEPATWAMMVAGFGIVGFSMRRRSNLRTFVQFN